MLVIYHETPAHMALIWNIYATPMEYIVWTLDKIESDFFSSNYIRAIDKEEMKRIKGFLTYGEK